MTFLSENVWLKDALETGKLANGDETMYVFLILRLDITVEISVVLTFPTLTAK